MPTEYSQITSYEIEKIRAVSLVEHSEALGQTHGGVMTSQRLVSHRMKRSAGDALRSFVAPRRTYAPNYFAS